MDTRCFSNDVHMHVVNVLRENEKKGRVEKKTVFCASFPFCLCIK